jgi:D-glycero-D-manno-heptose 1,7-bisphosphate phosphatase
MSLIVLDRDGTLIDIVRDEETGFVGVAFHPSHVRLLRNVGAGLRMLRDAGYRFAIATNQPAPAKGQFSRLAVEKTNAAVVAALASEGITIEHVAVCMHHPVGGGGGGGGDLELVKTCACRKPLPGLLLECLGALGLDGDSASETKPAWMIGDSPGDVQAGLAAGMRTAMVFDTKRCELCPLRPGLVSGVAAETEAARPNVVGADLKSIAAAILSSPLHIP